MYDALQAAALRYKDTGAPRDAEEVLRQTKHIVEYWVNYYSASASERDDMQSEGELAVYLALQRWQPKLTKFGTYAYRNVKGAMQHWVRDKRRLIQIPGWLQEYIYRNPNANIALPTAYTESDSDFTVDSDDENNSGLFEVPQPDWSEQVVTRLAWERYFDSLTPSQLIAYTRMYGWDMRQCEVARERRRSDNCIATALRHGAKRLRIQLQQELRTV